MEDIKVGVVNRDSGIVGYAIPELGVERQFAPREEKPISYNELEKLSFLPGGDSLLKDCLVIRDEEIAKRLLGNVEPEYFYTEEDIKALLLNGSQNEFLDCLDFAPNGVLSIIKDMAVSLPLNDMNKRQAILDKLNFDVTQAIKIKDMPYDDGNEVEKTEAPKRRVSVSTVKTERRAATPSKYNVVSKS